MRILKSSKLALVAASLAIFNINFANRTRADDADRAAYIGFMQRGDDFFIQGNFRKALDNYAQAKRKADKNSLARIDLKIADTRMALGELKNARISYAESIQGDPRNPEPYLKAAILEETLGADDQAETFYQSARGLNEKDSMVYLGLARLRLRKKDYLCAATLFGVAIALGGQNPGWSLLADANLGLGYKEAALKALEQAVNYGDLSVDNLQKMADLYSEQGSPPKALWALQTALTLSKTKKERQKINHSLSILREKHVVTPMSPFSPEQPGAPTVLGKTTEIRYFTISAVKDPAVHKFDAAKPLYKEAAFTPHPNWKHSQLGNRAKKIVFEASAGKSIVGIKFNATFRALPDCGSSQFPTLPTAFRAYIETTNGAFVDRFDAVAGVPKMVKYVEMPQPQKQIVMILEEKGMQLLDWSAEARLSDLPAVAARAFGPSSLTRFPLVYPGAHGFVLSEGDSGELLLFFVHASQLWIVRTEDGVKWSDPKPVPVAKQVVSAPAVVFGMDGVLNIAWISTEGNAIRLWMSASKDGEHWLAARPVAVSIPALMRTDTAELSDLRFESVSAVKDERGYLLALSTQYGWSQLLSRSPSPGSSFVYLLRSKDFRHWGKPKMIYQGDLGRVRLYRKDGLYRILGQAVAGDIGVYMAESSNPDLDWKFSNTEAIAKDITQNVLAARWLSDSAGTQAIALHQWAGDGIRIGLKQSQGPPWKWSCVDPTRLRIYGEFDIISTRRQGIVLAWTGDRDEAANFIQIRTLPYRALSELTEPLKHWQADIIKGLSDPVDAVRKDSAYLLRSVPSPEAVPELIRTLESDPDSQARTYAADTLWILADPRSRDAMTQALMDPNDNVRALAASGLQVVGNKDSVAALAKQLQGNAREGYEIRERIYQTIGALADASSIPYLLPLIRGNNPQDAAAIKIVIVNLTNRLSLTEKVKLWYTTRESLVLVSLWHGTVRWVTYSMILLLSILFLARRRFKLGRLLY